MRKLAAGLTLGTMVALAGAAWATSGGSACIADARNGFKDCTAQCKSDFVDAKGLCKGVSPGCYAACVDGRSECVDSATQPLTDCLAGCATDLAAARTGCKATAGCGGPSNPCNQDAGFIACMNGPQLAAFTCRDGCRDTFKLDTQAQATLHSCQRGFTTCVHSCPPAN
jgi:hypothetical protein